MTYVNLFWVVLSVSLLLFGLVTSGLLGVFFFLDKLFFLFYTHFRFLICVGFILVLLFFDIRGYDIIFVVSCWIIFLLRLVLFFLILLWSGGFWLFVLIQKI